MIEILISGPANVIQDSGRRHLMHLGVSRAGAMDRLSYALANAMLGNDAGAAAIEVAMFPFKLRFEAAALVAITGADACPVLDGRRMPPSWAMLAEAGSVLNLSPPALGMRTYLAFRGGIDVPLILGSRSTDLKTNFGGLDGRGLQRGDRLALLPVADAPESKNLASKAGFGTVIAPDITDFWQTAGDKTSIRVIKAAEATCFTQGSLETFFAADWQVTHDSNRMGYRLGGPQLEFIEKLSLFSHGILPGTVQVPTSGQPIIQLTDANTCGGYPKMAVVIEPDLWKIAQLGPACSLRFIETNEQAALRARSDQRAMIQRVYASSANGWP